MSVAASLCGIVAECRKDSAQRPTCRRIGGRGMQLKQARKAFRELGAILGAGERPPLEILSN